MKRKPDYDYTSTERSRRHRARAASRIDLPLDAAHTAALAKITAATGETRADCIRRLLRAAAEKMA